MIRVSERARRNRRLRRQDRFYLILASVMGVWIGLRAPSNSPVNPPTLPPAPATSAVGTGSG